MAAARLALPSLPRRQRLVLLRVLGGEVVRADSVAPAIIQALHAKGLIDPPPPPAFRLWPSEALQSLIAMKDTPHE